MGAQPERLMEAAEVWGARWDACDNPLARQYMENVCLKKSAVILAADLTTMYDLKVLIESVRHFVVAIKTHVDLIEDWNAEGWKEILDVFGI